MENQRTENNRPPADGPRLPGLLARAVPFLVISIILGMLLFTQFNTPPEIDYSFFREQLLAKNVADVQFHGNTLIG